MLRTDIGWRDAGQKLSDADGAELHIAYFATTAVRFILNVCMKRLYRLRENLPHLRAANAGSETIAAIAMNSARRRLSPWLTIFAVC